MSDGAYEQNSKSDIVSIFKSPFYSISNKVKSFMKRCQLKKTADNVTVIGIETKSTHVLLWGSFSINDLYFINLLKYVPRWKEIACWRILVGIIYN